MEWHAGGMRETIYPFADKQKIRYSRALLLARIMWKLKFDGFTALKRDACPATAGKSWQEISRRDTSTADALLAPALVFAGIQPMTAIPPRRGLAGCEAHDVDIPGDIDPIVSPVPAFVVRTQCGRSRESAQAPPKAIDVAVVQKRCNFQMGLLPDRHRGSEYSSALGCQAQPATTTIRRVCDDLDQAAPFERFECGRESGAVRAEER
jgi:hypothetical protein